MEITLIILTGALIGALFFAVFEAAYQKGKTEGFELAEKELNKEKLEPTKKNKKIVEGYKDFSNFMG